MCACVRAERLYPNRCTYISGLPAGSAASYQARCKREAYASSDDVDESITFGIHQPKTFWEWSKISTENHNFKNASLVGALELLQVRFLFNG